MRYQNWSDTTARHWFNFLTLGRILRVTLGMATGIVAGLIWAIALPL